MKQKLTILSKNTKALIIPNTILKQLGEPEGFEMELKDGSIILKPLKKPGKPKELLGDSSIDLYN